MNRTTGFAAIVAFTRAVVESVLFTTLGVFTFGAKSECDEKFAANIETRHDDDGAREPTRRKRVEDNIISVFYTTKHDTRN